MVPIFARARDQRCQQHQNSVTKIDKLSAILSHQHHWDPQGTVSRVNLSVCASFGQKKIKKKTFKKNFDENENDRSVKHKIHDRTAFKMF